MTNTRRSALTIILLATLIPTWGTLSRAGAQNLILDSATMGAPGQNVGFVIGNDQPFDQYLGARFQVTATTVVDHIGGHLGKNPFPTGDIFGAIVPLSGPTALPASTTVASIALAHTLFTPPVISNDILVPLSVTLKPGWYGLVFGSDEFGATGAGFMPFDNTDTSQASYFFRNPATGDWTVGTLQNVRFVVTGVSAVPAPSALAVAVIGALFLAVGFRRRRDVYAVG